ncbi:glycosyltransferase [Sphingomonas humi]|uniref:Glycosyl transferase family 1 domain-containing protein n=1 Tax=Sphingomonas humi TaxID=335630 RepID=A0ABP7S2W8_9SPHN
MLIGWATPFNYRSAIGKFSLSVANELVERGHEVVILRTETGPELELAPLKSDLQVVSCHEADFSRFDELVMNFGNHAPYHSQCIPVLGERAPFGIFHDAEMKDFAWGLAHRHGLNLPSLPGYDGATETWEEGSLVSPGSAPLLASMAAMCWGAMVHAPHYFGVISDHCPGPVGVASLCYPDPGEKRTLAALAAKPIKVTIFGVITEHKQPGRAMRALAQLVGEFGSIELHLAGAIEDRLKFELNELATGLGIQPPVYHGYLSDEDLQSTIEASSIVLVLRFPVTEGGSASLATALYRGRPIIVADIAAYSMVPDNLVKKVSYGEDPTDLASAMRDILRDPEGAHLTASRATDWAEREFQATRYCDALLEALTQRERFAGLAQLARRSAGALTTSSGEHDVAAVHRFAEAMDWLHSAGEGSDAK